MARRRKRWWAVFPLVALVAGCGGGHDESGANTAAVNAEAAALLDNAGEMLDTSPDSLAAPENMTIESESGNSAL